MMYSSTAVGSRIGLDLPSPWALLTLGLKALFVAFFMGLCLTVVWNAYVDGRVADAVLGASVLAIPAVLVALRVKQKVLD